MKLKHATLIAIIGASIISLIGIIEVFPIAFSSGIYKIFNCFFILGNICLLIFFIVLYLNQKEK